MGLGGLVTEADLQGLLDPTHVRGKHRRGFGKEVFEGIVGVWSRYDVTSSAASGANTLADALTITVPCLIKFPVGFIGDINITTDIEARYNKIIDARNAFVRITGSARVRVRNGFSNGAKFGWINVVWNNGTSTGKDCLDIDGSSSHIGRAFVFGMGGMLRDGTDEYFNMTQPPTLGFYATFVGIDTPNRVATTSANYGWIIGNNPASDPGQHARNAHMRVTMFLNNFETRVRHPIMNSAHVESFANRRRVKLFSVQVRGFDAIFRSRQDVFEGPVESATNNESIIGSASAISGGLPWIRAEGARYMNDNGITRVRENNRAGVTDASLYQDESGNSVSQYNDVADLVAMFAAMDDATLRDYILNYKGWFDTITLTGDSTIVSGAFNGKVLNLVNSVDNWPALTNAQKAAFISASFSNGPGWAQVKSLLTAANIVISGKTLSIVFPTNANNIAFGSNETVTFPVQSSWTQRSAYTEPDTKLQITGGGGGEPEPGDDTVVVLSADYSSVIRFDPATSTWLSPAPDPNNIRIGTTVVSAGGLPQRGTFRWDVSSLPDFILLKKAELLVEVNEIINASAESWDLSPYNGTGATDPDADTPQQEFDRAAPIGVFTRTTAYRTLGPATVNLPVQDWGSLIQSVVAANGTFAIGAKQVDESIANRRTRVNGHALTNPPRLRLTFTEVAPEPDPYQGDMARAVTLLAMTGR